MVLINLLHTEHYVCQFIRPFFLPLFSLRLPSIVAVPQRFSFPFPLLVLFIPFLPPLVLVLLVLSLAFPLLPPVLVLLGIV